MDIHWHAPNSLKDSNVSLNRKQQKSKDSGHTPWFTELCRGRGACWSFEMGLGRIDKLQLLTRTCTKLTQNGSCIVGALLVLGRATGNSDSQDSPRPGLGGSHHLPPYIILCAFSWGPHPNGILSHDSQMKVPKLLKLGFSQLWGPITLRVDLWLRWGLKQIYSLHQELSNNTWHAICTQGIWVDFWLLVVGGQTTNLTPDPSFGHSLCFRCSNGSCEPILDIYVSIYFQWYKKLLNPLSFDPCNRSLNIRESIGTLTPKVGVPLGAWESIPSHSLALQGACNMTPELPCNPLPWSWAQGYGCNIHHNTYFKSILEDDSISSISNAHIHFCLNKGDRAMVDC